MMESPCTKGTKSQTLNKLHVRCLIHLSLIAQHFSFFNLKKRQSFIGLWNQLKESFGNSNFTLRNQKKHFNITQKSV